MALQINEFFQSAAGAGSGLRAWAKTVKPKTVASGSGTLAKLTPVAFNTSTEFWQVWTGKGSEITTITADATPATAGTFTLTVDGIVTGNIAFDATAAEVKQAIVEAGIAAPEDVSAAGSGGGVDLGDANHVVTLTWQGALANQALVITADFSGLTGNPHVLAESQAGTAETGIIRGFIWPDAVTLNASAEVLGNVLLEGKIHYDDIVLPAGEAEADLKAAIQSGLRERGIYVEGLEKVR